MAYRRNGSSFEMLSAKNSWLAFAPLPSHPFSTGNSVLTCASGLGPAVADSVWLVERRYSRELEIPEL